jgi:hypothetical protein
VFFSKCVKLPPLHVLVVKLLFISKNVVRSQTWSLNFFFVNFDFSYFFVFFLSTSPRMRKINDFKTKALKVERVLKPLKI